MTTNEDRHREQEHEKKQQQLVLNPVIVKVASTVKRLAMPVLRIVFAPKAQRTLIQTIVITVLLLWVLVTSIAAYLSFYRRYVPRTAHVEPIYFQYVGQNPPTGTIDLTFTSSSYPVRRFSVCLLLSDLFI